MANDRGIAASEALKNLETLRRIIGGCVETRDRVAAIQSAERLIYLLAMIEGHQVETIAVAENWRAARERLLDQGQAGERARREAERLLET